MQKLIIKANKTKLEKPILSTHQLAKFAIMLVYDLKNKIKILNQHFIKIPQSPAMASPPEFSPLNVA